MKLLTLTTFKSLVGVRQGDVLSPNLFKIFINDLTTYLSSSPDPVYLNDTRLDCLMYADDVILLSVKIGVFLLILLRAEV